MGLEQLDAVSEQQFANNNGAVVEISSARAMEKTVLSIPTLILHVFFLIVLTIIEITICYLVLGELFELYVWMSVVICALIILFLFSVAALLLRHYYLLLTVTTIRLILLTVNSLFILYLGIIWIFIISIDRRNYIEDDIIDFLLYFALPVSLYLLFNGLLLFTSAMLCLTFAEMSEQKRSQNNANNVEMNVI